MDEEYKTLRNASLDVIISIANSFNLSEYKSKNNGHILNERYLHHLFSRKFVSKYEYHKDKNSSSLQAHFHPEWPTFKKQTGISFSKYKMEEGICKPNESGKSAYIDFALGDYRSPSIGIEFLLRQGWAGKEFISDAIKLMDNRNPFSTSILFYLIIRNKGLSCGKCIERLKNSMNDGIKRADTILIDKSQLCAEKRELIFIITELGDNDRRHWKYEKTTGKFNGTDLFPQDFFLDSVTR